MFDKLRRKVKYFCVHFWRVRNMDAHRCNNCYDRKHGGVWFFSSLGFK